MGLSRAVLSGALYASGDKQKQAEPVCVERVVPRRTYSTTAPHEDFSLSSDIELWTLRFCTPRPFFSEVEVSRKRLNSRLDLAKIHVCSIVYTDVAVLSELVVNSHLISRLKRFLAEYACPSRPDICGSHRLATFRRKIGDSE